MKRLLLLLLFISFFTLSLYCSEQSVDEVKQDNVFDKGLESENQKVTVAIVGQFEDKKYDVQSDFLLLNRRFFNNGRGDVVTLPIKDVKKLNDRGIIIGVSFLGNELITFPPTPFNGFKSLTHLNLSCNRLETLPKGVFEGLSLHYLSLWRNRFKSVPSDALKDLRSLTFLDLSENEIEKLSPEDFSSLGALEKLLLSGNKFKKFTPEAFVGLGSLKILSCYENEITAFDKSDFEHLPHLKRLLLDGEKIKDLSPETLAWCKSLEIYASSRFKHK